LKIVRVETIPVRLPRRLETALGTAGSPTPLAGSGDYRWSETVGALYSVHFETALVKITTDDGLTGWGEAQAPLAPEVACDIVRLLLTPVLAGAQFDPDRKSIAAIYDRMYQAMRVRGHGGGFMLDAISAVDLALWDLAGKARNRSVSSLIAESPPATVPAYWSGIPGNTAAEAAAQACRACARGFRVLKLFHDATPGLLLEKMDAIGDVLGPDARIAVDALWRLDPDSAAALGAELDCRGALWLEAPLPPEDPAAHGRLAAAIRTPLGIGESYRTVFELAPFFERRVAGFIQPDLGRCGITGFLRIAAAARRSGAAVVPHVSIALAPQIAAAVHAAATGCPWLEYNPNVLDVANQYSPIPIQVEGAAYAVPNGPGLGIDIEEEKLRARILPSGS
jgi:D-galactarolactone cycloisomerase